MQQFKTIKIVRFFKLQPTKPFNFQLQQAAAAAEEEEYLPQKLGRIQRVSTPPISLPSVAVRNNQQSMDPPHFFVGGKPPQPPQPTQPPQPAAPRKQVQIQGARPAVLKLHQDSHRIKKPPLPPQRQQPVIIYAVSPKIIHAEVSDFMSVVQRLTGLSSGDFSHSGAVSPAARLAATEKASPGGLMRPGVTPSRDESGEIMDIMEGLQVGSFPGILSPTPAMMPPVPTGFFSPVASEPSPSFFDGMSPFLGAANRFMASPSAFLSNPIVSPLHSPDFFNLFMDL